MRTPATPASLVLSDPTFTFGTPHGSSTRTLRLWRTNAGGTVAVITEHPDDTGMSVTNAAEYAWAAVQRQHCTPGTRVTVIEHYPGDPVREETFDEITVDPDGRARWTHLDRGLVLLSLGLDAYPEP